MDMTMTTEDYIKKLEETISRLEGMVPIWEIDEASDNEKFKESRYRYKIGSIILATITDVYMRKTVPPMHSYRIRFNVVINGYIDLAISDKEISTFNAAKTYVEYAIRTGMC